MYVKGGPVDVHIRDLVVEISQSRSPLFSMRQWAVQSGERVLLRGASGRGKTTFLNLLGGLLLPRSGEICVGDWHLQKMSEEERSHFRRNHVGYIFQHLNLIDHLTAFENVALGLNQGLPREDILSCLEKVGLEQRADDRVVAMSLGEQQRIAVARVLASQPQLVLADEPTSSLDAENGSRVMELLLSLPKETTLVTVSHDHRLEQGFDRVIQFEEVIQ